MPAVALEDYPDGTCFRTAFVGHASALSQAYYSPLRGASISLFREFFVHNYMHGMWHLPWLQDMGVGGVHGDDSADEASMAAAAAGAQPGLAAAAAAPRQHVIYLYNKTKDIIAPGFRCALFLTVRLVSFDSLCRRPATCGPTCVPCSTKSACCCLAAELSASIFRAWTLACSCRWPLKQLCT